MKKRVISILMVGALAMGLVTGCGSGEIHSGGHARC